MIIAAVAALVTLLGLAAYSLNAWLHPAVLEQTPDQAGGPEPPYLVSQQDAVTRVDEAPGARVAETPEPAPAEHPDRAPETVANFLDLVENFIMFDETAGEPKKIIARNHQFLGVNRAIDSVRDRKARQGKLGVFWHTQGSGKSYSMVMFTRKVHRKLGGNFSFLICTDREDLDGFVPEFTEDEVSTTRLIQPPLYVSEPPRYQYPVFDPS